MIENGIKEHPGKTFSFLRSLLIDVLMGIFFILELGIGSAQEGVEVRSVGNTLTLKETALVEAFNLKAAIEYELKNCEYFQ